MRTTTLIAFFALLIYIPLQGHAQALWNGTTYGMSVSEVREKIPNVKNSEKVSKLHDGSVELLRLESVDIVGKTFDALFYFQADRLVQVTLKLTGQYTFHSGFLVFESLTEALTAKYGTELSRKVIRDTLNKADATWVSGRTNISMLLLNVGNTPAILNVNYQARISKDADKL